MRNDDYRYGQRYLFPLSQITEEEIFNAYYDCIKHKRRSKAAVEFELDYEENLLKLLDEINTFSYKPHPYSVFVIDKPVKREVFAASFRDRIVHHLIYNAINPYIEKRLIYDCYACRVGKGTHFGIERLRHFMASSTDNWKREAWCLKLDIKGFFMSIDRTILWVKLRDYLCSVYKEDNLLLYISLIETVIFTDPTDNCIFRSPISSWNGLPQSKSLFSADRDCGLPIGNLTSQLMANFYMSFLDHYIKHDKGISMYGRYVDDFFLIHEDKDYLKSSLHDIASFLNDELHLELNYKKTILQPVSYGLKFLGTVIEPMHMNMSRRIISGFNNKIMEINKEVEDHKLSKTEMQKSISSINSYLGLLAHYDTYGLRKSSISKLDERYKKRVKPSSDYCKIVLSN